MKQVEVIKNQALIIESLKKQIFSVYAFVELVSRMMTAQQKYFKGGKLQDDLIASKELEAQVNAVLNAIVADASICDGMNDAKELEAKQKQARKERRMKDENTER